MRTDNRATVLGSTATDNSVHMRNNCICVPVMRQLWGTGYVTFYFCVCVV